MPNSETLEVKIKGGNTQRAERFINLCVASFSLRSISKSEMKGKKSCEP